MSGQPPAHQRSGTNRKSGIVQKKRTDQKGFFYLRIAASVGLCLAALSFVFAALGASRSSGPGTRTGSETKIAPWVLQQTGNQGPGNARKLEVLVVLADQADLSEAKKIRNRREKRRQVRDLLWNKAQQTQAPLLQWLKARASSIALFTFVNAIWVKADPATILSIAERPDVLRIEGNPQIRNPVEPVTGGEALAGAAPAAVRNRESFTRARPKSGIWDIPDRGSWLPGPIPDTVGTMPP